MALRIPRPRSAVATAVAAGLIEASAICQAQTRHPVPPPPEPLYHPAPGPYAVAVDAKGGATDPGVIDNAIRSWAGPKLGAYVLCFQPAGPGIDWQLVLDALDSVSRDLKRRGAAIVVVHGYRRCPTAPSSTFAGRAHVEVLGVLRDAD